MNWGVILRLYTMIGGVSAISLFVFSEQFSNESLAITTVAVATVALVSVILAALVGLSVSWE